MDQLHQFVEMDSLAIAQQTPFDQLSDAAMERPSKRSRMNDRNGTQSIERAVALLREISRHGRFGWQLSDLAAQCHLSKSTAHRMLTCLVTERLVRQRSDDRHYMPGPMLFELGLALPKLGELQNAATKRLSVLAKQTSSVAFLMLRSGDDFVCAARVDGTDLKSLTIFPGTRRQLVTSAGGVSMLLALSEEEASATIKRNLSKLNGFGEARIQSIHTMLKLSREEGMGVNAGDIVRGINSFGVALRDASGTPFASISLAGLAQTLSMDRLSEMRRLLQSAAEDINRMSLDS